MGSLAYGCRSRVTKVLFTHIFKSTAKYLEDKWKQPRDIVEVCRSYLVLVFYPLFSFSQPLLQPPDRYRMQIDTFHITVTFPICEYYKQYHSKQLFLHKNPC